MNEELGHECKWQIHDLRRTVRSRMSALKVPREVSELILGHAKKNLDRVYDQHEYEAEMREALEKWAAWLREIVMPAPTPEDDVEAPAEDKVEAPAAVNVIDFGEHRKTA